MFANLLKVAGGEAIARGANWVTSITLALLLSSENYGILILSIAIEAFFQLVGPLGHEKLILLEQNQSRQIAIAKNGIYSSGIVGLAIAPFMYVALMKLLSLATIDTIFICLALVVFGLSSAQAKINSTILRASFPDGNYARNRLIYGIFRLGLALTSAFLFRDNLFTLLLALILSNVICSSDSQRTINKVSESRKTSKIRLRTTLRDGAPFFWHSVSAYLVSFGDRFVVAGIADLKTLAAYGFWQSVVSGSQFLYAALSAYFEPKIYREISDTGTHKLLARYALISSVLVGAGTIALMVAINFRLLSNSIEAYLGFEWIISPLIFSALLQGLYFSTVYFLTGHGNSSSLAKTGNMLILANLMAYAATFYFQSIEVLLFLKCTTIAITPYAMIVISKIEISAVLKSQTRALIALPTILGLALISHSILNHQANTHLFIAWIIIMLTSITYASNKIDQKA
jgi:O-antigen/teichoic acid export membrane protein